MEDNFVDAIKESQDRYELLVDDQNADKFPKTM